MSALMKLLSMLVKFNRFISLSCGEAFVGHVTLIYCAVWLWLLCDFLTFIQVAASHFSEAELFLL